MTTLPSCANARPRDGGYAGGSAVVGHCRAMAPDADRSLLKLAINRLKPIGDGVTKQGRPARLAGQSSSQLGQTLMANWQARKAHDPAPQRDGLSRRPDDRILGACARFG